MSSFQENAPVVSKSPEESPLPPKDFERTDIGEGKFNLVSLTYNKIDVSMLMENVKSEKCGAVASFIGTTRDNFEDKTVESLSYSAYLEMALKCMNDICKNMREKYSVFNIVIEHKLGDCPVLDTSVAIIVSSAHRVDALGAVDFGINELKKTVPIWKKEIYSSGDSAWKKNKEAVTNIK